MKNLVDFALQDKYNKVKKLRSMLEDMKKILDWDAFLALFPDKETNRGRPEYEKILMLKAMFLQGWYSISDEELEYQMYNRLDFQQFLDFPESIPDYSTIWRFREELTEGNIMDNIWDELKRQIQDNNIQIKKGAIQDASFIEADPGKKNSGMQGRGREAKTSRSRDGSWTKKGKKSIFGFKSHIKVDDESKIITEAGVSTAKTWDGHIDLANEDEIVYRDRCYTGAGTKAKGDGTMKRGKLNPHQYLRNKRITKKRCRGEHPLGIMHRSFKAGRTKLTTLGRVFVQRVFVCMAYNVHRLRFLLSKVA